MIKVLFSGCIRLLRADTQIRPYGRLTAAK